MVDEFVYSEMAKSFAASGQFLVRDAPSGVNNVVYPALISPAWLAHPMGTTYALAKAINVVVMTATAIPLFLWARKLVDTRLRARRGGADAADAGVRLHRHADDGERLPAGVRACGLRDRAGARAADPVPPAGRVRRDPPCRRDPLPGPGLAGRAAARDSAQGRCSSSSPNGDRSRGNSCGASSGVTGFRLALLAGGAVLYVGLQAARGHTLSGGLGGVPGGHRPRYSFGAGPALGVAPLCGVLLLGRDAPGLGVPAPARPRIPSAAGREARPSVPSSP